ncbi:uncharacterized protein FOMMEDRAFT_157838 [Fomitiporia mediterranea MF3/22]|uniref:uncharacterized protein n=1 Tax=Fomitiporia mediterranea (strain MF3/22) TaxID=694068 RepID=UPI0004409B56|nr:uncharacterized protein FOMMEDRAFT_157838 [Fomitiporia mediterranea MF3/22]EJD00738.1 hypothetical protein FOMMEDRAFT_157838 [Fomitiporia mediterranea MF3/22]
MRLFPDDTASPAAQIISFNAPDHDPGAPLTLATRYRDTSISSLQQSHNFSHKRNLNLHNTYNLTTGRHTQFNLQGPSDD